MVYVTLLVYLHYWWIYIKFGIRCNKFPGFVEPLHTPNTFLTTDSRKTKFCGPTLGLHVRHAASSGEHIFLFLVIELEIFLETQKFAQ